MVDGNEEAIIIPQLQIDVELDNLLSQLDRIINGNSQAVSND